MRRPIGYSDSSIDDVRGGGDARTIAMAIAAAIKAAMAMTKPLRLRSGMAIRPRRAASAWGTNQSARRRAQKKTARSAARGTGRQKRAHEDETRKTP
jgi:hypothetical protein